MKLLKAGCEKFQEEFESHAVFNPTEKCITIASACNRFWRKKLLPIDTIAVEPPRGWQGAQTNTSVVARQWLAYRNHCLRLETNTPDLVYEDPIKTSTNGGEVRIQTPGESYLVDGYDAATNTIYEFHGCTVPPETIYPFTEVLPQPIRRSTPRSRLGNDAACRNFTEVLPRFATT